MCRTYTRRFDKFPSWFLWELILTVSHDLLGSDAELRFWEEHAWKNKNKWTNKQKAYLAATWGLSEVIYETYDHTMSTDGMIQLNDKLSTRRTWAYHSHTYMFVHTWGSHIMGTLTINAWLWNVNVIKVK